MVGDKGYHSNQSLVDLEAVGVRSYISEPDRGRRNWKKSPEARAVYRNRQRIRGARGQRLLRLRGERWNAPRAVLAALVVLIRSLSEPVRRHERLTRHVSTLERRSIANCMLASGGVREMAFTTGC